VSSDPERRFSSSYKWIANSEFQNFCEIFVETSGRDCNPDGTQRIQKAEDYPPWLGEEPANPAELKSFLCPVSGAIRKAIVGHLSRRTLDATSVRTIAKYFAGLWRALGGWLESARKL
jgi:hypothetical protein